jgi:hypothetical protein
MSNGALGQGDLLASSLGPEPVRHSPWIKSNGGANSENGIRPSRTFDWIGASEQAALARYIWRRVSLPMKSAIIG